MDVDDARYATGCACALSLRLCLRELLWLSSVPDPAGEGCCAGVEVDRTLLNIFAKTPPPRLSVTGTSRRFLDDEACGAVFERCGMPGSGRELLYELECGAGGWLEGK